MESILAGTTTTKDVQLFELLSYLKVAQMMKLPFSHELYTFSTMYSNEKEASDCCYTIAPASFSQSQLPRLGT